MAGGRATSPLERRGNSSGNGRQSLSITTFASGVWPDSGVDLGLHRPISDAIGVNCLCDGRRARYPNNAWAQLVLPFLVLLKGRVLAQIVATRQKPQAKHAGLCQERF